MQSAALPADHGLFCIAANGKDVFALAYVYLK